MVRLCIELICILLLGAAVIRLLQKDWVVVSLVVLLMLLLIVDIFFPAILPLPLWGHRL